MLTSGVSVLCVPWIGLVCLVDRLRVLGAS